MNEKHLLLNKIRKPTRELSKLNLLSTKDLSLQNKNDNSKVANIIPLSSPSSKAINVFTKAIQLPTLKQLNNHTNSDLSHRAFSSSTNLSNHNININNIQDSLSPYYSFRDSPHPNSMPFTPRDSQKQLLSNTHTLLQSTSSTKANPFEIDPEDRIFDILRAKKKKKEKKKKVIKKESIPHQRVSYSESRLQQVYQEHKALSMKLEVIKQQKDQYTLSHYQNKIIDTMSGKASKDLIKKLIVKLYKIRAKCEKQYVSNMPLLGELEETEEDIIENANNQNDDIIKIVKKMGKNKHGREFKLSRLYFKNIINKTKKKVVVDDDDEENYIIEVKENPIEIKNKVIENKGKINEENNKEDIESKRKSIDIKVL